MTTDEHSNTASNSTGRAAPGKPFRKGDPRINRKGRPRGFDELRKMAIRIAGETLTNKATGEQSTVVDAILRRWIASDDWRASEAFMQYAFGKVPNREEISGPDGGPIPTSFVIDIGVDDNANSSDSNGEQGEQNESANDASAETRGDASAGPVLDQPGEV
jgi:hypothetical protein